MKRAILIKAVQIVTLTVAVVAFSLFGGFILKQAAATTGGYNLPDFNCPAGSFVSGARFGRFICSPLPKTKPGLKVMPRGYGQ